MGVTLTYDAERSASSSALTSFGEGWDSNFSASLVYNSSAGSIVVNEGNGSQLNFQTPSGSNCPAGSYNDPEKYTLPGSSQSFCAPNRVDAQAGVSFAYNTNELAENGQKSLSTFNYLGQLVYTGDMANPTSVGYQYSISPGSQSNCPTSGEYMCIAETDQFGHSVVAFQNIYGIIGNIWDPIGTDYIIGYGGNVDLESISNGGFDDSTWNFTPQGGAAPYAHEITAVTTPDGGQEQIFYSNGMVSQENAPDGQGTTFTNYTQTTCATSAGCTTNGQNVDVTYPDGEHDLDSYFDGLLVGNEYGADTNFTMADANFGFNYVFPGTQNQDAPTTETVVLPSASPGTGTILTDSVGNVTSYTDPNGNVTTSMYNNSGGNNFDELCWTAAAGVTIPNGASCSSPPTGSTTYTYDSFGNELSETDPLGNTTRSGYYTNELLCWTAQPTVTGGSSCTNTGSSPNGAPVGSTDYTYDAMGDVTSKTVAQGTGSAQATSNDYDGLARLIYTIPPDGSGAGGFGSNPFETAHSYWGNSNLASTTAPLGRVTNYTDDLSGNVINESDPGGVTSTAYDSQGRVCWTLRSTSAVSNPNCSSPPGQSTITGYLDDTSAPLTVTDPNGQTTHYGYSDLTYPTQPNAVLDPMANEITYNVYDIFGRTCVTGAVSATSCAATTGDTYNNMNNEGQLVSSTDPNGLVTSYGYTNPAFPADATSVTSPSSGTTNYTYDADGNQIESVDAASNTVSTAYDADGRECYIAPTLSTSACSSPPTGVGVSTYA